MTEPPSGGTGSAGPPRVGRLEQVHGLWPMAAAVGGVLLLAVVLSQLWPPHHWVYGGTDASNYVNNGARHAEPSEPAFTFLPESWDLDERTAATFTDIVVDEDGRMSKFTQVEDGEVRIPQHNLYARLLRVGYEVDGRLPWVLNYVLWTALALVLALLARNLTRSWPAAAVTGGLVLLLPSYLVGARFTKTEALATLLVATCGWLTVRTRGMSAFPGLLLVAAWLTRPEFIVPLAIWLVWATLRERRGAFVVVLATVAGAYLLPYGPAGQLFQTSRFVFSLVPSIDAWLLPVAYAGGVLVRRSFGDEIEGLSERLAELGRRPVVHRVAWLSVLAVAIVFEAVRMGLEPKETLGPLIGQRFSTLGLLVDSMGWPLAILGAAGLVALGHRMAGRAPFILAAITVPHVWLLVRLHSSPTSEWSYTRRFHQILYPVLLIGVALVVAWLVEQARQRISGDVAIRVAVAGVVVLSLGAAAFIPLRDDMRSVELSASDLAAFDAAAEALPSGSFVLMADAFGGAKAQIPLRTYHGHWSFVVYDPSAFDDLASVLDDQGATPLYIERELLDEVQGDGLVCPEDPARARALLPVRFSERVSDSVDLIPVTGCRPAG